MSTIQRNHSNKWAVRSWREYPVKQQPIYNDEALLEDTLSEIGSLPPIVFPEEIDALRESIKKCQQGKMFFLQGGDCAERFADCHLDHIVKRVENLERMATIIEGGIQKPVVKVGRMAGQYAKPRSSPFEDVNGVKIPSFKGDNINSLDDSARNPDPARLHRAYLCSVTTMNTIRGFVKNHPAVTKSGSVTENTDTSSLSDCPPIDEENFFVSHEALMLSYEEQFTKYDSESTKRPYNLSAHFLWIGERTRNIEGAHIEYFRGIANPIGVKVGSTADPAEIVRLLGILNPDNEDGKIVLISRMGLASVKTKLEPIVQAVRESGANVLWVCDPMHGNTFATEKKIKTRNFAHMIEEITLTFNILNSCGTFLGGIHLEMTWEPVTECIDGSHVFPEDLTRNYTSSCDPRLNGTQCENISAKVVEILTEHATLGE